MVSEKTLKVLDTLITELKIGYCKMCQMITKCMCYNEVKRYFKYSVITLCGVVILAKPVM